MKERLRFQLFSFIILLTFSGCYNSGPCESGLGDVVITEIQVDQFDRINMAIAGEVVITKGPTQRVTVESNGNIVQRLNKSVNDGEWFIGFRSCIRNYDRLNIFIETPNINGIILSGSGNIVSQDTFESTVSSVTLSGSGNLTASFDVTTLSSVLEGSGNINLSGTATTHNTNITGSGNIGAFDLTAETCTVDISGSGNLDVTVTNTLDVRISGSGNVRYKGDPALSQNITGSGSVRKVN